MRDIPTKSLALTLALLLAAPVLPALGSVSDLSSSVSDKSIDKTRAADEMGYVSGTGGAGLNFRSAPWGAVKDLLKDGTKVAIVGKEGDWYKVKVGGESGYVHSDYVDKEAAAGVAKQAEGTKYVDVSDSSYLNVRSGPWGEIKGKLHRGDKVEIVGRSGDWLKIKHGGGTAYVHSDYLDAKKPAADPKPADDKAAPPSGGAGWGGSPCPGPVTSNYGWRIHPVYGTRKFHTGVDIGAAGGTALKSLGPGKVTYAGWNDGYGNIIKIQHDNGYESYYAHCRGFNVKVGQRVGQGQQVGTVNSTGCSTGNHLHFEIRKNGQHMDPRKVPGVRI